LEAVNWFINEANCKGIIADGMGLGKTGEVYLAWRAAGYPLPCLLIAGRNAQIAWLNQADDWGSPAPVIIRGKTREIRKEMWAKHGLGFVAITRESLKLDIRSGFVNPNMFKAVIVDECHKDSNRKSGNFESLKAVTRHASFIALTSGSIARRGPQSMWAPLNIVRPKLYTSYWRFLERYCIVTRGEYGVEIHGTQNEEELKRSLSKVMIRRTNAEVRPQMPPKVRDLDSNVMEMSDDQRKMYNSIIEEQLVELPSGGVITIPSILAKIQRLRQVLVTPKLLSSEASWGAGLDRLSELLEDADDQHMAVFTPFASALPFIRERLLASGIDSEKITILRGGLTVEELSERIAYFKRVRGIALCSIRYAESFDLQPATWGVFLGFEWDAWDNLQAEDRLHRGEISNPVNIYYIRYKDGIDSELVLNALDTKVNNVMAILRDIDQVRQMLKTVKPER
jgi:SNF2 family DNA or RNA helicase